MKEQTKIPMAGFSVREQAEKVIADSLNEDLKMNLPEAAKQAARVVAVLRQEKLLRPAVEQHYSAADAAELCGFRSTRWIRQKCMAGAFGNIVFDGGGFLIPASGLKRYLEEHTLCVGDIREEFKGQTD